MTYSNFQFGWATFLVFVLVGVVVVLSSGFNRNIGISVFLLLLGAFLFFGFMTTEVNKDTVKWRMGIGLVSGEIPINEICGVEQSRSKWYTGWGVRRGTNIVLYNVSGFERVSFRKCDGSTIALGTDDPKGLIEAVRNASCKESR